MEDFDQFIAQVTSMLESGKRGDIHCRAGVGRAGLVASCVLLKIGHFDSADQVINYLRAYRHKMCVETLD